MRNQTVREILDRSGYKHRYLAERINVSTSAFGSFVGGRAGLQATKLRQLSTILGVSMDTLQSAYERSASERQRQLNGHANDPLYRRTVPLNEDV